jgi:hypothetical protein
LPPTDKPEKKKIYYFLSYSTISLLITENTNMNTAMFSVTREMQNSMTVKSNAIITKLESKMKNLGLGKQRVFT